MELVLTYTTTINQKLRLPRSIYKSHEFKDNVGYITLKNTTITKAMFEYSDTLKSVTIPDGVTIIGDSAFDGCKRLASVVIPNGVTSIGNYAFYRCTNLTSIEIPNSVTCIGNCAFYRCTNLTSIEIPNSVTCIGDLVLSGCENLKSIEIPNSVASIGEGAFEDCVNLTSINIPNRVTNISRGAFYGCKRLTSIEIPNSVTLIHFSAFDNCISLTSIKIPSSVTKIGLSAFRHLPKVEPQYNANGTLRAFKSFYSDWTCRGFQYAIGKSYHQDGEIKCGESGFHACTAPLDVYNYYYGAVNKLRFAEVELSGKIDWKEDKVAASDIRIVRELSLSELAEIYNSMEKA